MLVVVVVVLLVEVEVELVVVLIVVDLVVVTVGLKIVEVVGDGVTAAIPRLPLAGESNDNNSPRIESDRTRINVKWRDGKFKQQTS